jgi:hypothetical protein
MKKQSVAEKEAAVGAPDVVDVVEEENDAEGDTEHVEEENVQHQNDVVGDNVEPVFSILLFFVLILLFRKNSCKMRRVLLFLKNRANISLSASSTDIVWQFGNQEEIHSTGYGIHEGWLNSTPSQY